MRDEQIKAERRRRNTAGLSGRRQRLSVDESKLDRSKYHYHFANDDGVRIHQLTVQDDYEVVPDRDGEVKPGENAMGANVSTLVGTGTNGAPMRAVLLRKLKTYHDDDQAAKAKAIDEKEASLKSGAVPGAGQGETYVPGGSNRIGRG